MKHIFAAALFIASVAAHAQTSYWTFNYTGFYDREAAVFLPGATLSGAFSGVDANRDGVLERGELTSLTIGTIDYVACSGDSNATYHCGADSFRFAPDSGLSFSVGQYGSDPEGLVGSGHIVTTGDSIFDYQFNPNTSTEHHLDWNPATTLNMVAVVPEPVSCAMLAAGLAGIALYRRRRA
jgi:hypothetical protein